MKLGARVANMAGVAYAFFFYIRFEYGVWDFLALWSGNLAFILGFILMRREDEKSRGKK